MAALGDARFEGGEPVLGCKRGRRGAKAEARGHESAINNHSPLALSSSVLSSTRETARGLGSRALRMLGLSTRKIESRRIA